MEHIKNIDAREIKEALRCTCNTKGWLVEEQNASGDKRMLMIDAPPCKKCGMYPWVIILLPPAKEKYQPK